MAVAANATAARNAGTAKNVATSVVLTPNKITPARFWLAPLAGPYFSGPAWETLLER
jgi:hypothetical protein